MTIHGHFPIFNGKKIWIENMTMLYPNLCYIEVCYERTALFIHIFEKTLAQGSS